MAIRIPDFNTQMGGRVPDANLTSVGSAEAESYKTAGAAIAKMGGEIKDRALAQAKSAQFLKAKEAYFTQMTKASVDAEYSVDQFTGQVGTKLFQDHIATQSDEIKSSVKKDYVDPSWQQDFDAEISASEISAKTNAIIQQAKYTSTGAKESYNTLKYAKEKEISLYDARRASSILPASQKVDEMLAEVDKGAVNGNIPQNSVHSYYEDAKYSMGKVAKENVIVTGNWEDLFSLTGYDIVIPAEYIAKSKGNPQKEKELAEFEKQRAFFKDQVETKQGNYHQTYARAQKNLLLKYEDNIDLVDKFLRNRFDNANAAKKSVDDQIPNIVAEISDTISPNHSGRQDGALKQGVAQGKTMLQNGAEHTDTYDSMAKMHAAAIVTDVTSRFAMQPSAVRRSQMVGIENQVKAKVLKDFPELAADFAKNPTMGSKVGEITRGMMDDADKKLLEEYKKNKEDYVYKYDKSTHSAWDDVLRKGKGNPAIIQRAVEITANAVKKVGGYYSLSEAELQHGLVPNHIASSYQFELENAATKKDFNVMMNIMAEMKANGTASGAAYKIEKSLDKPEHADNPLKGISHMIGASEDFQKKVILAAPGYKGSYNTIKENTVADSQGKEDTWAKKEREMSKTVLDKMSAFAGIQGQGGEASRIYNEILDKTKMIYSYKAENSLAPGEPRSSMKYDTEKFAETADEVFKSYYKPFKTESSFFGSTPPVKGYFSIPAGVGKIKEDKEIQDMITKEYKDLQEVNWKYIDTNSPVFKTLQNDIIVNSKNTTFGVTKGTLLESDSVKQKKVIEYFADKKKIFYAAPIENEKGSVRPYIELNGMKYEIPFKESRGHIPFKRFAQ